MKRFLFSIYRSIRATRLPANVKYPIMWKIERLFFEVDRPQ
jgi:hypothetical protein